MQRVAASRDRRATAEVSPQHEARGAGKRALEVEQVLDRRPTPAEHRMVVVADDHQRALRRTAAGSAERREQRELRGVGVLKLVDQDVGRVRQEAPSHTGAPMTTAGYGLNNPTGRGRASRPLNTSMEP